MAVARWALFAALLASCAAFRAPVLHQCSFTGQLRSVTLRPPVVEEMVAAPAASGAASLEMRVSRRGSSARGQGVSSIRTAEKRKQEKEHPDQPYQVYVGNLPWKITEQELKDWCSQAGRVVVAKIKKNSFTGLSKGFGFVRFSDPIYAVAAVDHLNGQLLDGREITVKYANAPTQLFPPQPEGAGATEEAAEAAAEKAA